MAARPSNRLGNSWTVELLDLRLADRVLEIGYGPGCALELAARRIPEGRIVDLDHSPAMRARAVRRNAVAISEGRMTALVGSVDRLPENTAPQLKEPFDKIFGLNVTMFWKDPVAVFKEIVSRLARGGTMAFTHQPRAGDRTDAAALETARRIHDAMAAGGLAEVRIERLEELSPIAVCVIGERPGP